MEGYHVAAIRYLAAQALRYRQGAEGRDTGDQGCHQRKRLPAPGSGHCQHDSGAGRKEIEHVPVRATQSGAGGRTINFHRTLELYVLGQARG